MSGIYDVTLAAGAAANIGVMGTFAKVLTAPAGAVQLKLDGGEGYSLLPGQGVRSLAGKLFRDVMVKNLAASAQTVTVFVGDASFEDTRITGNVTVIDAIGSGVRSDAGSNTALLTFTASAPIVAPASNPNGILIRAAQTTAKAGAGGNSQAWLIASPSSPVGPTGAQMLWISSAYDSDQLTKNQSNYDMHKMIPAGWGLYFAAQNIVAVAAANSYFISYEVL
jgi:hypothetical protein